MEENLQRTLYGYDDLKIIGSATSLTSLLLCEQRECWCIVLCEHIYVHGKIKQGKPYH
jgi:hypothetical protein